MQKDWKRPETYLLASLSYISSYLRILSSSLSDDVSHSTSRAGGLFILILLSQMYTIE